MVKNKNLKRKPTPFAKAKQKETNSTAIKDVDESASEQEVNIVLNAFDAFIFILLLFLKMLSIYDSRN